MTPADAPACPVYRVCCGVCMAVRYVNAVDEAEATKKTSAAGWEWRAAYGWTCQECNR